MNLIAIKRCHDNGCLVVVQDSVLAFVACINTISVTFPVWLLGKLTLCAFFFFFFNLVGLCVNNLTNKLSSLTAATYKFVARLTN